MLPHTSAIGRAVIPDGMVGKSLIDGVEGHEGYSICRIEVQPQLIGEVIQLITGRPIGISIDGPFEVPSRLESITEGTRQMRITPISIAVEGVGRRGISHLRPQGQLHA